MLQGKRNSQTLDGNQSRRRQQGTTPLFFLSKKWYLSDKEQWRAMISCILKEHGILKKCLFSFACSVSQFAKNENYFSVCKVTDLKPVGVTQRIDSQSNEFQ